MSRPAWPALLLVVAGIAACSQDKEVSDEDDEVPAIPVEIATPERGDMQAVYSGTAPIEAFADAEVIAKVGGEVRQILVEEGDTVKAGQVLARLDGDRFRFELQQAEANLRKLQQDYQRHLDLKERSLISEGDFEKIQFEMEALEATANLARLELGYTEIRAPIAGVVSERFIKVGNTIPENTPTFHVTSLEPLISYLHVPEREYRRISPGQLATVRVDALQGMQFTGTVARISPVVDPGTGTFKITIEVSDESQRLKPGMFGRMNIVYDTRAGALQIPRSAIVEDGGDAAVFVVENETARRRAVTTGYSNAGRVEILEGLDENEAFVVVGQTSLRDGSRVSVINAGDAADVASSHSRPTSD